MNLLKALPYGLAQQLPSPDALVYAFLYSRQLRAGTTKAALQRELFTHVVNQADDALQVGIISLESAIDRLLFSRFNDMLDHF